MSVNHRHLVRSPRHHLADASVHTNLGRLTAGISGFNAKTAVIVPAILGSMGFFWTCVVLAVVSLPAILTAFDTEVLKGAVGLAGFFPQVIIKASLIALVAWVAQTFIQLVALPVLQVSSNAGAAQEHANVEILLTDGEATREHTEKLLDAMDVQTDGGLKDLWKLIDVRLTAIEARLAGGSSVRHTPPKGDER